MYEANKALAFFVTNNFNFKNYNFVNLNYHLRNEDLRDFQFDHFFRYDVLLYLRTAVYGFRKYLLNLKDEDLERDRVVAKRLIFLKDGLFLSLRIMLLYVIFTNIFW